jgi:uncharacterized membrane protein
VRAAWLDGLRGLAVVWMVIFHVAYDMRIFGFNDLSFDSGFWFAFPRIIAFTFLFCVGGSLNFTHYPKVDWNNLKARSLKIGGAALIISVATSFLFPDNWVFFGTLHCIFVGSILGALFVNHRKLALAVLIAILTSQYALSYDIKWVSSIIQKPSMDFIPIYPWFWAILLGMLLGPYLSKIRQLRTFPVPRILKSLGKHSLKIYLLHQPLIFGVLWMVKRF